MMGLFEGDIGGGAYLLIISNVCKVVLSERKLILLGEVYPQIFTIF